MATTKYKLAEQISLIIKGSLLPVHPRHEEIVERIGQVINSLLKVEAYAALNDRPLSGDVVPHGAVIATYDNQTITAYKTNYSKVALPATPVRLVKGMGVYHIGPVSDPFTSWIPIPAGQFQLVSQEPLISDILGQIGYEVNGSDVIFTTNLTTQTPAITECLIRLIVMDMSTYGDYDPLPIPADMEDAVIRGVLDLYQVRNEPDAVVDPVKEDITKK